MIAALFVQKGGCYFGLPDVDPWDEVRDARLYPGPHPVVAHPPCERWGAFWSGGPSAPVRKKLGDDGGCFASALDSARKWGGVIEHPEDSHAWRAFGLLAPQREGGWWPAGDLLGWTCRVEQGHYGHEARKATWLYVVGALRRVLPELKWGPSDSSRMLETMSHRQRAATPQAFRALLLSLAGLCSPAA